MTITKPIPRPHEGAMIHVHATVSGQTNEVTTTTAANIVLNYIYFYEY